MEKLEPPESVLESEARRAADRLAVALEDVGFDVGIAFPMLHGDVNRDGIPVVDLGQVTAPVAAQLATVLARATGTANR